MNRAEGSSLRLRGKQQQGSVSVRKVTIPVSICVEEQNRVMRSYKNHGQRELQHLGILCWRRKTWNLDCDLRSSFICRCDMNMCIYLLQMRSLSSKPLQ